MPDQPQLVQAFDTIRRMATTTKKTEKEKILKGNQSEYLQTLLRLAYNKFITFGVKQIEQPGKYNSLQPDTLEDFTILCDKLATRKLSGNAAGSAITAFLAKQSPDGAIIYTNVLLRDLRGGFDEKTINKVFPGLIPVFEVQLANKVEEWDKIRFPVLVEEKLDGVRTLAVYDGSEVKFYSREGREFDECGVIAEQIKRLLPGVPFVLDGEFIATKFNKQNKTCLKYQTGNWPFNYGLSLVKTQDKTPKEVAEHLGYFVWDVLDLDYFQSGGFRGECLPLEQRKLRLSGMFLRHGLTFKNVFVVPSWVCQARAEVQALFREMRDKDKEGVMVKDPEAKYDFRRSNAVLKLKEFFNLDLRVVGAEEGQGKYAGKLGALVVADDAGKIKTNVGSGFDDLDRSTLWLDWLNGSLKGKIVEVCAQEVTKDGSLRFPTYVGLRFDKSTTNTEGVI